MTLPYPGYSWSFNHHMGRVNSREVFALLESAYRFRQYPNYRSLINQALVSEGIFTPNVRADSGQIDAWRDYQQILPDLGLIYSTRYIKQPQLTTIGLMYIDGTIGYSELFSTQVLAYQYPNGHKTDISPAVREELSQAGISIPINRMELDINSGILIKPGVLILQVLVELYQQGYPPTLNTRECLLSLVPTIRNSDWQEAYTRLLQIRQTGDTSDADKRRFRDVQEWFQFLGQSDFVVKDGNRISLSSTALAEIEQLQTILDFHTDPATFWIPPSSLERENALAWYSFFGSPSVESQWITPDELRNQEYLSNNYPDHELLDEIDSPPVAIDIPEINLRPFSLSIPEVIDVNIEVDVDRIVQGRMRLRDKTRQHQEIVVRLATRLIELSYNIADDPNSVDLLAEKNGFETIFEIKTINRRNFQPRIRLGVGQLLEYRYRRQLQTQVRPNSILVLSNTLQLPPWTPNYFSSEVNIGLLCSAADSFLALTDGAVELEIQNTN
ncbi:hypothetical protein [Planktothrix sp. FACHB-1365]|uniref:hypothetical protein n=1 Tax=Planktothrix sp. FACHB-1365 TaxID=2692855 RepID=UPI0016829493|nr:hypothetical protein [Planktothrix sp. FACHB-1365]MBD2484801.1 hypothetical protein [Planktothrix sp. FACHB-1365]